MALEVTRSVEQKIAEMVRRIAEEFHPEMVILFGSHARGTAGPDSDVDMLVVMPVKGSRREQAIAIEVKLAGLGVPKDVIVVTPEEFKKYRDVVGSIVYPAFHEGHVVYDQTA